MEIDLQKTKYCKYLRAKNPYGGLEGGENAWLRMDDANTICWCIKSASGAGPDNGLVAPDECRIGRSCFVFPND